ncbi:MAG: hypothetical protein F4X64_00210 [Chloroflexi bacterium]|nr:hypothetical protein [Chloroflexota bacterium]
MSIHVAIEPGLTPEAISVQATGYQDAPISADILKDAWGIDDLSVIARSFAKANGYDALSIGGPIWDASSLSSPAQLSAGQQGQANFARNINRCFVRLAPTGSRLLEIDEEVVLADHAIWDNRANPDPRKFKADMSVSSTTSVESSWEHSQSIGISAEIGTKIGPVDAKTTISYKDSWGEGHAESRGEEVSFSNEIEGELEPGELQVAALTQQRGFAKIQTDFAVAEPAYHWGQPSTYGFLIGFSASGSVKATYEDHPRINVANVVIMLSDLLNHAGKPGSVKNSRIDTIGVFADADLASYPLPDTSEESIRRAAGARDLRTIYPAQPAARSLHA